MNVLFDNSGNYIVGSMYSEFMDDDFFYKEYLGGIGVWNANAGDLMICIRATCDATKEGEDKEPVFALSSPIGFTIDPRGEWTLIYGLRFIKYVNLNTKESSSITYGTQIGEDLKLIGNVAFDYQGRRIAIAYQEGGVVIQKFPSSDFDLFSTTLQESQNSNVHLPVAALSFSPNNKWLARIYQSRVTVWNVEEQQQGVFINEIIPDVNKLSFDPSSNLLFVATSSEIAVLNLKSGKKMTTYNTPDITSMTISKDGRLVIWGDQHGKVHFLGFPEN
jgi:WD40 repeat protein